MVNFDNKMKKQARRGFTAIGIFLMMFALFTYIGLQLPFYNSYNPLYSPFPWLLMGFLFFIARTYVKDKKGIANMIDFFDRSGLIIASYEIPFENISPIHANYINKDGEKSSIRHTHPFAIPSSDTWTNEFLVPSTGLESMNPTRLLKKYGAFLKDININIKEYTQGEDDKGNPIRVSLEHAIDVSKETLIAIFQNLSAWIPEISALDPQVLHEDEVESDSPDGLNQEGAYQVAEIRKGWFSGTKTAQAVTYILLGGLAGAIFVTFAFLAGHVDFAHINGVILHP